MSKPFSVTAYCKRLGLTDRALGDLLELSKEDPARGVRHWRTFETTKGKLGGPPSRQAVLAMQMIELAWRIYHAPGSAKAALEVLLPAALKARAPQ